jgi:pyruvate formate lyase activating enzyme
MEAMYYQTLPSQTVKCLLCPQECVIQKGRRGLCNIRFNSEGTLIAETHQLYSAIYFDPIEKKPLYHFYPGKEILSLGSVGCNMHCYWCQNCEISQHGVEDSRILTQITPEKIVELALSKKKNIGIAFTYNEPSISIENVVEIAELGKTNNLKNVMVTNGFIGQKAMENYISLMDAFNIDIKAFNDDIYKKYTGAKLIPVLDTIKMAVKANRHVELTYLVVTGINDTKEQFDELIKWIVNETGRDTVLHLSRYFPKYKMNNPSTPSDTLHSLARKAKEMLSFVYLGNIDTEEFSHTFCPKCKIVLISRKGYFVLIHDKLKKGICAKCGTKILVDN